MSLQFLLIGLVHVFACLDAKPVIRPGIQEIEYLSVKPFVVETMKFECYEKVIPSVMINVRWFINDIEILEAKHSNISAKDIEKALLLKYHWDYRFKLNMNVKCLIEFVNPGNPVPLQSHYSDDFVAGIVINNGDLDVTATTMEKLLIPVKLTIPFVCKTSSSLSTYLNDRIIKSICGINFEVAFPASQNDDNCTQIDTQRRFYEPQQCGLHFKYGTWNKTQYVTMYSVRRVVHGLQQLFFFKLNSKGSELIVDTEGTWKGMHTPTVKISLRTNTIIKRKKICKVINGMHISSFDGRVYEFNNTDGEYTIYRHNAVSVQINAVFWKCKLNKICTCGVAVRCMDSVFVANFCSEAGKQNMEKIICSVNDMTVHKSGNQVTITTQTVKITLDINSLDNIGILIESSYSDVGMTSGLCGLLNDNVTDDMIPNGLVSPVNDTANFTSSWREIPTDSLFSSNRTKPLKVRVPPYCGCLKNAIPSPVFTDSKIYCHNSDSMNRCLFYEHPLMQRHCDTVKI